MKGNGPVYCHSRISGTKQQHVKLSQWGTGRTGSGPSGWKMRKAKVLARSQADALSNWYASHGGRKRAS